MTQHTTTLLTVGTLAGLAVAAGIAWRLGGAVGTGVLGGYLMGASLSALGVAWQHHLLRTRPERVFSATVGVFVLKLAVLLCAALAFRYVEPAARQVDWRSFLVAFAAGVLLVIALGSMDTLRILKQRRSAA
jgi:hypothetical protein